MKTFAKSPIGLFIYLLGAILLPSCQEGCIDPSACNYQPDAVKDDGTCIYECTYESEIVPSPTECLDGQRIFYDVQSQVSIDVINQVAGSSHFGEPIVTVNVRKERYKSCLNDEYQYLGIAEDVIAFQNVSNRTISFDYKVSQVLSDGSTAVYKSKAEQLFPGRAVVVNTEKNIFPLLDHTPLQVKLTAVRYHR